MLPFASASCVVTVVIDSGIENTYEVSFCDPTQTKPACKVRVGVLPEVVTDGEYKSVAYGNIVGVLIEAIKEQQKQIDELKKDK